MEKWKPTSPCVPMYAGTDNNCKTKCKNAKQKTAEILLRIAASDERCSYICYYDCHSCWLGYAHI